MAAPSAQKPKNLSRHLINFDKRSSTAMRPIVSDILTLVQYVSVLKQNPERFKPKSCPHCFALSLYNHGHYDRKADRDNPSNATLNPIAICRFFCPRCKRTCSTLPECIPPRRWYLWTMQQYCLLAILSGCSLRKVEQQSLPHRSTLRRWFARLSEKFTSYSFHLKSHYPILGRCQDISDFWQQVMEQLGLSKSMLMLNLLGEIMP